MRTQHRTLHTALSTEPDGSILHQVAGDLRRQPPTGGPDGWKAAYTGRSRCGAMLKRSVDGIDASDPPITNTFVPRVYECELEVLGSNVFVVEVAQALYDTHGWNRRCGLGPM